jgi:hypothetical protein
MPKLGRTAAAQQALAAAAATAGAAPQLVHCSARGMQQASGLQMAQDAGTELPSPILSVTTSMTSQGAVIAEAVDAAEAERGGFAPMHDEHGLPLS